MVNIASFYEDSENVFPCELAMAKFSLQSGIIDVLHMRINPGPLPLGAARLAFERAHAEHKYPIPKSKGCPNGEESSYILILDKIVKFMMPFDGIPMFFANGHSTCNHDDLLNTQRALCKIFEEAREFQIARELKVHSVSDLFYRLQKDYVKNIRISSPGSRFQELVCVDDAHNIFTRTDVMFHYSVTGCDYHYEQDCVQHCALSKVRRFCYIISAFCSNMAKYPLVKGSHYPEMYNILS
jgi:hypothetical protein